MSAPRHGVCATCSERTRRRLVERVRLRCFHVLHSAVLVLIQALTALNVLSDAFRRNYMVIFAMLCCHERRIALKVRKVCSDSVTHSGVYRVSALVRNVVENIHTVWSTLGCLGPSLVCLENFRRAVFLTIIRSFNLAIFHRTNDTDREKGIQPACMRSCHSAANACKAEVLPNSAMRASKGEHLSQSAVSVARDTSVRKKETLSKTVRFLDYGMSISKMETLSTVTSDDSETSASEMETLSPVTPDDSETNASKTGLWRKPSRSGSYGARPGQSDVSKMRRFLSALLTLLLLPAASLGAQQQPGTVSMTADRGGKRELYIAGFFPFSGPLGAIGRGVRPAVELAVNHINNDDSVLPGVTLNVSFSDTKCNMAVATKVFFDMTYDSRTTEAILFGDACYNVSGPIAQISRQWGMFQLSYGDTDPVLSDRDKYPNFFRIVPSDSDFNPARLALLRHFNWSIVGTLFQDASLGAARYGYAHNRFDSLAENSKINITKVESFSGDPSTAIQNLKERDVRIIVGNFDEDMARRVFCSARQKGMYGPRHQWIILGTYSRDWWRRHDSRVACSPQELHETLHGYLATDILPLSSDDERTESGWTPEQYRQLYEDVRGEDYSVYHGYAYDGIWVIARALERLLGDREDSDGVEVYSSLEDRLRGIRVGKALNDTNIRGVTGRVQFNNGDRLGIINILQMQGSKLVKVAEYKALTEELDFGKGEPVVWWKDDKPPKDRTVQYEELRHVSTPVYLALVTLASTGIIMACCFLGLNIHFRRHRFIKMSSPNLNNVIICGCILCYFSIVLLGTDGSMASSSPALFRYWCRARAWVLSLGFTLAFGAMFSKTWRVHAIFTNIKLNRKVIKDYKLMLVVMVLVMLDVALLVAWQVVDPFQRAEKRLVPEVYEDYEVIPKLEFCSSRHMEIWMGSIYAYKGLLLAFGCFLAWETRHVSIPALNDSKYIGMSVYNVVIMCTCGAAVTFLIQDQPTHSFLIIAVFILFATTATLCLVFVPKIIQLRRDPKGDDKRIRATFRKTSRRYSEEGSDHFQHKIRLAMEENRRLNGFLEQKAAEMDHLLEELGEDPSTHELSIKSALHKKVMALRTSDNSPSKTSRASAHSDGDQLSTYSDVSSMTTTLYVTDSPPSRPFKARLLNNRMHSESIELTDIRQSKRRKSSVTVPPTVEDEDDDPFGGVYLGPPDPPPLRQKPPVTDMLPPRRPVDPAPSVVPSSVPNSCSSNSTSSNYEPPVLGVTSSCYSPQELSEEHVDQVLHGARAGEEGALHYSQSPIVLLLQGQVPRSSSNPCGRPGRSSHRMSTSNSIFTIAEVREEDIATSVGHIDQDIVDDSASTAKEEADRKPESIVASAGVENSPCVDLNKRGPNSDHHCLGGETGDSDRSAMHGENQGGAGEYIVGNKSALPQSLAEDGHEILGVHDPNASQPSEKQGDGIGGHHLPAAADTSHASLEDLSTVSQSMFTGEHETFVHATSDDHKKKTKRVTFFEEHSHSDLSSSDKNTFPVGHKELSVPQPLFSNPSSPSKTCPSLSDVVSPLKEIAVSINTESQAEVFVPGKPDTHCTLKDIAGLSLCMLPDDANPVVGNNTKRDVSDEQKADRVRHTEIASDSENGHLFESRDTQIEETLRQHSLSNTFQLCDARDVQSVDPGSKSSIHAAEKQEMDPGLPASRNASCQQPEHSTGSVRLGELTVSIVDSCRQQHRLPTQDSIVSPSNKFHQHVIATVPAEQQTLPQGENVQGEQNSVPLGEQTTATPISTALGGKDTGRCAVDLTLSRDDQFSPGRSGICSSIETCALPPHKLQTNLKEPSSLETSEEREVMIHIQSLSEQSQVQTVISESCGPETSPSGNCLQTAGPVSKEASVIRESSTSPHHSMDTSGGFVASAQTDTASDGSPHRSVIVGRGMESARSPGQGFEVEGNEERSAARDSLDCEEGSLAPQNEMGDYESEDDTKGLHPRREPLTIRSQSLSTSPLTIPSGELSDVPVACRSTNDISGVPLTCHSTKDVQHSLTSGIYSEDSSCLALAFHYESMPCVPLAVENEGTDTQLRLSQDLNPRLNRKVLLFEKHAQREDVTSDEKTAIGVAVDSVTGMSMSGECLKGVNISIEDQESINAMGESEGGLGESREGLNASSESEECGRMQVDSAEVVNVLPDGKEDSTGSGDVTTGKKSGKSGNGSGGVGSGGSQVYPEQSADCLQPSSLHNSQVELWASPITTTSSSSSSPARVTFACDVIEKI